MKKIKLDTVVAIGNIVSSLILIVSIIILINEYKQTEVINEKNIENLVYDRMMELDRLVIENPDLGEIISIAYINPDSLSAADKIRYVAYEHIFYDSWETIWVGYQNGVVREETWNDWNEWFISAFKKKPALSWQGNIDQFSSLFLEFLNHELEEIGISNSVSNNK